MPWIEVHCQLISHPKLFSLMRMTGWDKDKAIGKIIRLWLWCLEYCEDGNLSKFSHQDICDAIGIEKDQEKFYTYLIEAGWIDDSGVVHDWLDYVGRYLRGKYNVNDKPLLQKIWEMYGRTYGATTEQRVNREQIESGENKAGNLHSPTPQNPDKKEVKKTNPDVKVFIDWWYQEYLSRFEQKYVVTGKDPALIKRLLGTLDLETLKKCALKFFESNDPFILKAGFTIGVFLATINRLAIGSKASDFTDGQIRNIRKLKAVKYTK